MKIRLVGAEFFHVDRRMERHTTKPKGALLANATEHCLASDSPSVKVGKTSGAG